MGGALPAPQSLLHAEVDDARLDATNRNEAAMAQTPRCWSRESIAAARPR